MKGLLGIGLTILLSVFAAPPLLAEEERSDDRKILLDMLATIEQGLSNSNLDNILPLLDNEVVVTFINSEVTVGPQQTQQYFNKVVGGVNPLLQSYSTKAAVTAPAIFYGDTAVAHGTTQDRYEMMNGSTINVDTNWTTTLVKKNQEWKVVALHFSANLFDNPFTAKAQSLNWLFAGISAVLTFLVVLIVSRLRKG